MLMVVGVVVLMIVLLALMLEKQHLLIRQIGNQRVAEQANQYSQGLNAWAIRVLHADANTQVDHEKEKWAKFGRPEPEPTEGESESFSLDSSLDFGREDEDEDDATIDFGIDTLEVTIDDLQAKFNLNNLASISEDQAPPQGPKRAFLNLLQILEIGEFYEDREELYSNLVDWMDSNDTSAGTGAESNDYQIRSTPYFASDQPLTSIGELRYVKGFNKKVIRKLKPYVTVLPINTAKLNLNTVSPEVLASLTPGTVVDASQTEGFLARKQQPGFQGFAAGDTEGAWNAVLAVSAGSVGNQPRDGGASEYLDVKSSFFQINTKVELGDFQVCSRTVVLRKGNSATIDGQASSEQTISVLSREQDTVCQEDEPVESTGDESNSDEDLR